MTETPHPFCPACGHNLAAERPVAIGKLDIDPRGFAMWDDRVLHLTSAEHIILSALALARGRIVTCALLEERLGYEGLGNVVQVFLVRIRRKLRDVGAPDNLVMNLRGRGYRLNIEELA